ncbi:MAG: hypothetical protein ACYC63_12545 [Armatimonadota bacterium]
MDFTTFGNAGALNGFDIVLWLGFLYLAPRLLKFQPRKQIRRRNRTAATVRVKDVSLRVA